MGGAVIERDTTFLPLSLVLKEMNMITGAYEGEPRGAVSGLTLPPPLQYRPAVTGLQRSCAKE